MKFSQFKTDTDLERQGVWVDLGDGAKILICRTGTPAYVKEWNARTAPHKTAMRHGGLTEEQMQEVICGTYAATVLINWEGMEKEDGTKLPYSTKAAEEALLVKDFRALVMELAGNMETFKAQEKEDTIKKSAKS